MCRKHNIKYNALNIYIHTTIENTYTINSMHNYIDTTHAGVLPSYTQYYRTSTAHIYTQ